MAVVLCALLDSFAAWSSAMCMVDLTLSITYCGTLYAKFGTLEAQGLLSFIAPPNLASY
jgi:hypothetical protein